MFKRGDRVINLNYDGPLGGYKGFVAEVLEDRIRVIYDITPGYYTYLLTRDLPNYIAHFEEPSLITESLYA